MNASVHVENVTDITSLLQTTIQHPRDEPKYYALALLFIPLMTVFGNCLVVISVIRERSLQTVTNYCICSLAVSDFFVATAIMPFAVYIEVVGQWHLSKLTCDIYIAADVCGSTASILNLVAICSDRYLAVTRPWSYSRRNKTRAGLTIGCVWFLAVAVSLPVVFGINKLDLKKDHECVFTHSEFILVSSVVSFFIPCVIMIVLYSIVFIRLQERQKTLESLGVVKGPTRKRTQMVIENSQFLQAGAYDAMTTVRWSDDEPSSSFTRDPSYQEPWLRRVLSRTSSDLCQDRKTYSRNDTVEIRRIHSTTPLKGIPESDTPESQMLGSACSDNAATTITPVQFDITEDIPFIDNARKLAQSNTQECVNAISMVTNPSSERSNISTDRTNIALISTPKTLSLKLKRSTGSDRVRNFIRKISVQNLRNRTGRRRSGSKTYRASKDYRHDRRENKERKATITLAVVVGVFLVCFVPFFTLHTINSVCRLKHRAQDVKPHCVKFLAFFITTWIGYMNSFMNPIIYTIFNPDFRKAFRRLLCRRHRTFG